MSTLLLNPLSLGGAFGALSAESRTAFALQNQYVAGTSGGAWAVRYALPFGATYLKYFHWLVQAVAGTPAGDPLVTAEVRKWSSATSPDMTGGGLLDTKTVNYGSSATKWKRVGPFTAHTTPAGPNYVVLGNAEADAATAYPSILYSCGPVIKTDLGTAVRSLTSTNGFNTAGTARVSTGAYVLEFDNGAVLGNPYTNTGNWSNNQLLRGNKWLGPTEKIKIAAIAANASTAFSKVEAYLAATAPGGAKLVDQTLSAGAAAIGYEMLASEWTIEKAQAVIFAMDLSTNATAPGYFQIEDSAYTHFADILRAGVCGGTMYGVEESGGAWVEYTDRLARMLLIPSDQVAIAGGGDGRGLGRGLA